MEENENTPARALLWILPQVASVLQIGKTKGYELICWENLPVVRLGKGIRVSPLSLQYLLEEREEENVSPISSVPRFRFVSILGCRVLVTALQSLIQALISYEREVHPLITQALKQMGNAPVSELEQALRMAKGEQRRRIVRLLKQIRNTRSSGGHRGTIAEKNELLQLTNKQAVEKALLGQ